MPGFRSPLTERSIRQTAAYVQSLSRTVRQAAPGDVQRGAAVYAATGCGGTPQYRFWYFNPNTSAWLILQSVRSRGGRG